MTMEITAQRARVAAAVALALGLAFVAASVWGPLPGDDALESAIESGGDDRALRDVAEAVTALGDTPVALATVAALALVVWRVAGPRLALVLLLAALMAPLTKLTEGPLGSDSPSGHAAYAAAVFGFCVVLALAARRRLLAALAGAPVVAMPLALVLIDSHSPTEALAGLLLGAGWLLALLATVAGGARPDRRRRRHA
jgi:membrane-associated phospholipid phosphatase